MYYYHIGTQLCMPTNEHSEKEVDEICDRIKEYIKKVTSKDELIVMGDWNSEIVEGRDGPNVGV